MNTQPKIVFTFFTALALAFCLAVPASADIYIIDGDSATSGQFTITGVDIADGDLDLYELLIISNDTPASTTGLTAGDIWTELNSHDISQAWALEIALGANQTGENPTVGIEDFSVTIGSSDFAINDTINVSFGQGASDVNAIFRTDNLGYNFMAEFDGDSTVPFTFDVTQIGSNDGKDIYSLNSVTVTPEPISTVLFLLGGAPMAAALYRKRKKA